ncbi:MAG: hypothetical protein OXG97_04805 [Candidatus Poribacteria bacterium]|nr:hypothetical protein [Candidatus Poribacteria bacterium]
MLQFPVKLNHQHRFEYNQQWYVVDLEVGEVVQIDGVIHSILDYCETCTFHELIERLKHKYPKQTLFAGIRKLERLAKLGLVCSQNVCESILSVKNAVKTQTRLFVLHSLDATDPYLEDSWALLRAMAESVEINYALFNTQELPPTLRGTNIQGFFIQTEGDHSLARYLAGLADSYNALLLLHGDSLKVLQLLEYIPLPVIIRTSSDIQGTTAASRIHGVPKVETVVNNTLALHTTMRPFDAAVIDSPWLYHIVSHLLNQPENLHFIPVPKQIEANRLPDPAVLSHLSNLFEVDLTSTPLGALDKTNWDSVAKGFIQLLTKLINKRSVCESAADVAFRFSQRYNPTSGEVSSQAVMFSSLLKHNMSAAIIEALSKDHTERELELVRAALTI